MFHVMVGESRRAQRGHGLAEYCLIIALMALAALGLYLRVSGGVEDLWSTANSTLVNGNASTSGTIGQNPGKSTR